MARPNPQRRLNRALRSDNAEVICPRAMPICYGPLLWRSAMAKKTKNTPQTPKTAREPNAYAARLARQVTEELSSGRDLRKKKVRSVGK
jgi:hypothetical protein